MVISLILNKIFFINSTISQKIKEMNCKCIYLKYVKGEQGKVFNGLRGGLKLVKGS